MKDIFVTLFLMTIVLGTNAQSHQIRGRVVELSEEKAIPFESASVKLLTEDSVYIQGMESDTSGNFNLKNVNRGDYILTISFLGYRTTIVKLNNLSQDLNLADIILEESDINLNEVTISSDQIIQKIDRQILIPTKNILEKSSDTYDLLNRLMVARLYVDPINKSLSVNGGSNVQLRINGIKVSKIEFSAVQPKDIIRVEFIEDPGSQYREENLGAIVNLIVRREKAGGQVNIQMMNSPTVLFGENSLSFKYNIGKSEWGLNYANNNRGFKKIKSDVTESFKLSPNDIIERRKEGINSKLTKIDNAVNISYNLYTPDKHTLNIFFKNGINNNPTRNSNSKLFFKGTENDYYAQVQGKQSSYTPSLDIYYQQFFKHNQSIEFNVVGTLIHSEVKRDYMEYGDISVPSVDINSAITGKKYSLIAEGIYHREFKHLKLNTGFRHMQVNTQNEYTGSNPYYSQMQMAESYGFAEIQGRADKFSYGMGVGIARSWFKENGRNETYYTFSPTIRLGYAPHKNSYLRYAFNIKPTVPSLGSLTNVEQELDTIQIVRGNPSLQTYKMFDNSFSYSYKLKKFRADFNLKYLYYDNPIMESIFIEDRKIIIQDQNQKSYQKFNLDINFGVNGIAICGLKDFLSFSVGGGYSNFQSNGLAYSHKFDDFYINFMAWVSYKKISLLGQYRKYQSNLFAETINKGENLTLFMLNYGHRQINVGVSIMYPFTNDYNTERERKNEFAPLVSKDYVNDLGHLIAIRLSYNFNFGRKYNSSKKNLNNQDRDSGILNTDR